MTNSLASGANGHSFDTQLRQEKKLQNYKYVISCIPVAHATLRSKFKDKEGSHSG